MSITVMYMILSKFKSIDENCHDRRTCNWFCSLSWMDKTLLNYHCSPKQSFIALYTLNGWSSKSQYSILHRILYEYIVSDEFVNLKT